MISEQESSVLKSAVFDVPISLTIEDLQLKVKNLEKALKTQQNINMRLEHSIRQQKQDHKQARHKSKAWIMKLEAKNAKLELMANPNAKLAAELERLKICMRKQKVDHKRAQNQLKSQCRELSRTNNELKTKIKDLDAKGSENVNGRTKLSAKAIRKRPLEIQVRKQETELKRINQLESDLAASAALVKNDTNSRFRRPKKFFQEEVPTVKRTIKPRYERSTTFPVTKTSRFARPDWVSPQIKEQSNNYATKTRKIKQHGRGCLLLWPRSMLNEAEELFQLARKKNKVMVAALLAIPVPITIA